MKCSKLFCLLFIAVSNLIIDETAFKNETEDLSCNSFNIYANSYLKTLIQYSKHSVGKVMRCIFCTSEVKEKDVLQIMSILKEGDKDTLFSLITKYYLWSSLERLSDEDDKSDSEFTLAIIQLMDISRKLKEKNFNYVLDYFLGPVISETEYKNNEEMYERYHSYLESYGKFAMNDFYNSKLNNTRSEFFSDRVHFYLLNIKANLARELIMDMYPTDGCIGRFNKLYSSSQYYKYLDSFLFIRSGQEEDLSHHISLTTAQEEENHDKLMVLASSLITQCMDTTDPQFLYILENFVKTPTDSKESRTEKANREAAAEMLSSCNTNTDNKNANDENEEDEVEGSDFVVDDNLTAACEMLPVFYNETVSNSTNNLNLGERYLSILYGINIDNFSSEVLADPILTDAQKYIDEKNSGNGTNSSNSSSGASCIKNDPNTYDELLQTINSSIAPPGWEAEYLNYNYNIPIEMDKDCLYEYILTQTENLSTSLEGTYTDIQNQFMTCDLPKYLALDDYDKFWTYMLYINKSSADIKKPHNILAAWFSVFAKNVSSNIKKNSGKTNFTCTDYDIPTFLKAMEMFREEDTDLYSENQDVFDTLLGQAINGIVVETPDENQFSKTMEEIPTSAFSTFLKSNSKAVKLHEKLANSDATLYANENYAKYIDSSVRNAFYDENLEEIMYDCAFGEEETTVICKNSVNRLNVLKYLKSLDLQNLEVKNLVIKNIPFKSIPPFIFKWTSLRSLEISGTLIDPATLAQFSTVTNLTINDQLPQIPLNKETNVISHVCSDNFDIMDCLTNPESLLYRFKRSELYFNDFNDAYIMEIESPIYEERQEGKTEQGLVFMKPIDSKFILDMQSLTDFSSVNSLYDLTYISDHLEDFKRIKSFTVDDFVSISHLSVICHHNLKMSYMNRLVSSHKQCFCSGEAEDSEESDIDDSLGDPWEILKEWLKKNASALMKCLVMSIGGIIACVIVFYTPPHIPLDMKVYDKGSMLGEPKDYARLQLRKRLMEKNFLQLFNITKDEINQWAIEHEEKKADKIYTKFRAGQIIDYYRTIEN